MPRYEDDDRDDYDDRPRRRKSSSGSSTTWIILGVVGGVLLLTVVGCVGGIFYFVNKAGQAVNQFTQQFAGMQAAEAFCEDLKSNRATNAYNSTTTNYQAGKSRAQ